ncbi:MAG: ABC transporter ATP-binding protein [Planctomycetota bacterium]|nr:ABC transporter ATP-binding protein [Planctomycetota bacterium]
MMLQIRGLRFSYGGGEDVLAGATFDLPAGCLAAILGENGSGKTTLLKTVNRLLRPREGVVLVDGQSVAEMSGREIARRFGYMPQRQDVAHCTVFEAVLMGRKARDGGWTGPEDIEKVERALRLVRMERLAMRPVTELSGGETQKAILARALAQEPKVLLLDEPINHLDPLNQVEIMSLLRAICGTLGVTALIVTHDLSGALRFADRFVFMKGGRAIAAGGREVFVPETVREAFGVEVAIGEVGGVPVVVPMVRGERLHIHIEGPWTFREHIHEVGDNVYDHKHGAPGGAGSGPGEKTDHRRPGLAE